MYMQRCWEISFKSARAQEEWKEIAKMFSQSDKEMKDKAKL